MAPFIIQTHREKLYCNSRNWRKYKKRAQENFRKANKCDDLDWKSLHLVVHVQLYILQLAICSLHFRQPGVEYVNLGWYHISHFTFCISLFTVRQPGVEHVKLGSYRILHQQQIGTQKESRKVEVWGPDLSNDFVILPFTQILQILKSERSFEAEYFSFWVQKGHWRL